VWRPVEVISRDGPWLKIRSAERFERYLGNVRVPIQKEVSGHRPSALRRGRTCGDCSAFWGHPGTHHPIPLNSPEPEYSDEARKARIQGSVEVSFTVGIDGIAHDIVVTKSLGHETGRKKDAGRCPAVEI